MPLQLSLAVGLGSSFQYQLRIGTPKSAEPTATEAKAHSSTRSQQLACVLFTKIPPEIRRMIYRHLLVSGESILLPRKRASHETVVNPRNGSWGVSGYGIDATLMQTCQTIYGETVPILYGDNEFQFTYPKDIGNFQNHGLKRVSENCYPEFQFNATPYGRLKLLRTIHLNLKLPAPSALSVFSYAAGQPDSSIRQEERDCCWKWWSQHVFDISMFNHVTCHGFPALETLTLDFSSWHLTEDEGVFTKPFLRKFQSYPKLRHLKVKGVKHGPTLDEFRTGFLMPGKVFEVMDS